MPLGCRTARSLRALGRRWGAALLVGIVTLVASLTTSPGPLYAQVYEEPGPEQPGPAQPGSPTGGAGGGTYPGRSTKSITDPKQFERSLTRASLRTGFDPEQLVENETTRFTAAVSYARDPDPGPTVWVAYSNNAYLQPFDPQQFEVVPRTSARQNLDDGQPDEKGGLRLEWTWDVTPRATGSLTLQLVIEPVVVLNGAVVKDLEPRNQPILIDVLVHPQRKRFDAVVAASGKNLAVDVPNKLTAEEDVTVTADLPLGAAGEGVQVDLTMAPADGSVPVTVREQPGETAADGTVHGTWTINPGKEGEARLALAVVISTDAGDRKLEKRVELPLVRVVDPAPAFWSTALGIVGGLAAVLGLLGALATFHTQYRAPLVRLRDAARRVVRRGPPASP